MPQGFNGKQFKLETTVVSTDTHRTVESERFMANVSFPNVFPVDEDVHVARGHFRAQSMVFSFFQAGNLCCASRRDVVIAVRAALRVRAHAWIPFDGNHQPRPRLDPPHGIHQVAAVLGAQLEAKLAAYFAGAQRLVLAGGPQVGKLGFRHLLCG